jgi:hypothetical protein
LRGGGTLIPPIFATAAVSPVASYFTWCGLNRSLRRRHDDRSHQRDTARSIAVEPPRTAVSAHAVASLLHECRSEIQTTVAASANVTSREIRPKKRLIEHPLPSN